MTNTLNNTLNLFNATTNNYFLNSSSEREVIVDIVASTQSIIDFNSKKDINDSVDDKNGDDVNAGIIAAACAGGFILLVFFIWLIFRYRSRKESTPARSNKRRFQEDFDNKNFVFEEETLKIERPLPPEPKIIVNPSLEELERAEEAVENPDVPDSTIEKQTSHPNQKTNGDVDLLRNDRSPKNYITNGEIVVEVHRELTESEKNLRDLKITQEELDYHSSINEIDKVLNNEKFLADEEDV